MQKQALFLLSFTVLFISNTLLAQKDSSHFVTTWRTDSTGLSNDSAIYIEIDTSFSYNFDIDWNNDGVFDTLGVRDNILIQYPSPGTYTIRIRGIFPSTYFEPFPVTPFASQHDQEKLISIDQWGTYPWKKLAGAFKGCSNLTNNATDAPNLTNVNSLVAMFNGASSFNADLNHWDVSNIQGMNFMFEGATNFNGNISSWDVSNVLSTTAMFADAIHFNQDVSGWDVSSLLWANFMFAGNRSFNQDISNWDVDSVVNMDAMFIFANQFNQDLSNWNIQNVNSMVSLFDDCGLSISNYDLILNAWQAKPHQLNVNMGVHGLKYCLGNNARSLLIADGWSIAGDSLDCQTVSLEERKLTSAIRFYPNPTKDQVFLDSAIPIDQVKLYSVIGTVVKSSVNSNTLSIRDLPNGNYIIEIVTRYGNKRELLVKN